MPDPRWKVWLLGGLALTLGVVGAVRVWPVVAQPSQSAAPPAAGPTAGEPAAPPTASQADSGVRIDFEGLEQMTTSPAGQDRNPFQFGSVSAAPAPAAVTTAPVAYLPPATGAQAPPAPDPIPFRFIGTLRTERSDGVVAVLADDRGVYHGREGEIIEGQYRIVVIGEESIQIERADGRGRQTIRLTGS